MVVTYTLFPLNVHGNARMREVPGQEDVRNVKFSSPDAAEFSCKLNGENVMATVIEICKR